MVRPTTLSSLAQTSDLLQGVDLIKSSLSESVYKAVIKPVVSYLGLCSALHLYSSAHLVRALHWKLYN